MVEEAIFRELSALLLSNKEEFGEIYLVGGYIRDQLSRRPSKDFDFVFTKNPIFAARLIADHFSGSFYVMDSERQIARALIKPATKGEWMVDCSRLSPQGIQADQESRDFSINAIAINIESPDALVDSLNGIDDLKHQRLRLCSPSAFVLDPVRTIRAVRFIQSFGLEYQDEIKQLIRDSLPALAGVSKERIRDEVFKVLSLGRTDESIQLMDEFGLFSLIFPELPALRDIGPATPHMHNAIDHTLRVCELMDLIIQSTIDHCTRGPSSFISAAVQRLKPYREDLMRYYHRELTPGRNLLALSQFAGLYHDAAKSVIQPTMDDGKISYPAHAEKGAQIAYQRGKALSLSTDELDFIKRLVCQHMAIEYHPADENSTINLWLYRLFKQAGDAAIAGCILHLADILATYEETLLQERWDRALDSAAAILDGWFRRYESVVEPIRLVSGDDMMRRFGLPQGPLIGELIEQIRESQVIGAVSNQEEAIKMIERTLAGRNG